MKLALEKYINDKTILLNKISTYPDSWIKFLKNNYDTVVDYNRIDAENQRKYKDSQLTDNILSQFDLKNKKREDYEKIISEFNALISSTEFKMLCFHATRLTKEEIINIKENGLTPFNSESVKSDKLKNLLKNGYIDKQDFDSLCKSNLLNTSKYRENHVHFVSGSTDFSCSNKNKNNLEEFLMNYGGEVIYRCKNNDEIKIKLNKNSFPCFCILKLNESYFKDYYSCLSENIIKSFSNNTLNSLELQFVVNCKLPVEDIIEIEKDL